VVERPTYLEINSRSEKTLKSAKMFESLKIIEGTTKAMRYDTAEFDREFDKKSTTALRQYAKAKDFKLRLVRDGNQVYIWLVKKFADRSK
jgi:hypothetical protein